MDQQTDIHYTYRPTSYSHSDRQTLALPSAFAGKVDPSIVITHRLPLKDAPKGYHIFDQKEDNCVKVVLKPGTVH